MKVKTDIRAGDVLDDIARGVERAGTYFSQLITQADAQASQLTSDIYLVSSSLVNCVNESIQKRNSG